MRYAVGTHIDLTGLNAGSTADPIPGAVTCLKLVDGKFKRVRRIQVTFA